MDSADRHDGVVAAAAARAIGAIAAAPCGDGGGVWGDKPPGIAPARKGSGSPSWSCAGEEACAALARVMEDGDAVAHAAAAAALGRLAATRLRGGRGSGNGGNGGGGGGEEKSKSGDAPSAKKTSGFGHKRGGSHGAKSMDAETAAAAAAAAAAAIAAAAGPLDMDSPAAASRWAETTRLCFAEPFARSLGGGGAAAAARGKRLRVGLAAAIVAFVRASNDACAPGSLPPSLLARVATDALRSVPAGGTDASSSSSSSSSSSPHAAACALYILRAGVLRHVDEAGQRLVLGALLATLPGGEASDGVDARVAARAIAVAIECMGSFAAEDATFRETADALTTALRVCGESEGERGVSECAAAVRALAAAAPATAAATLRRTLETIRGGGGAAGVGAVVGAAAAAAALTAAADALELGIPAGLLLDAALVGGAVAYGPPSASFESNAAKARGWDVVAAAIQNGPAADVAGASCTAAVAEGLSRAFDASAFKATAERGDGGEGAVNGQGAVNARAGAKKKDAAVDRRRRPGPGPGPPAEEIRWRAAAASALAAFASRYPTHERVPGLLDAALACAGSCGGVGGGGDDDDDAISFAWPADPAAAAATATLRLRVLEAFLAAASASPPPRHQSLVAAWRSPFDDASGALLSLCTSPAPGGVATAALLAALDRADDALGPSPRGRDALLDELRSFDGASDAPDLVTWRPVIGGPHGVVMDEYGGGAFPGNVGLASALRQTQAAVLARVAVEGGENVRRRRAAALDFLTRETLAAAGEELSENADTASSDTATSERAASGPMRYFKSKKPPRGGDDGEGKRDRGSTAALTNACAFALAVASAFENAPPASVIGQHSLSDDERTDVGKTFARLASVISRSAHGAAAHWRAAASLDARAARLHGDAVAAVSSKSNALLSLPATRSGGPGDRHLGGGRAVVAMSLASAFRTAGALAHGGRAVVAAATRTLSAAATQVDVTPSGVHLWSLHALSVVATHAGPGFHAHADDALRLAAALLDAPEARYAPAGSKVRPVVHWSPYDHVGGGVNAVP